MAVRPAEVDQIRRLLICSTLVGFALVFFFSGSNALFLERVGADTLPWVYIVNAPVVIAAGFGYALWSRLSSTTAVLKGSSWVLAASVALLWLWNLSTDGLAAPFALAVWFRFLFIFGFLGLWEIASAVFDVRQSKRLFPAVALGAMVAFMVGGALVGLLTALIGTVHLIAVSAGFFVLYSLAFARAMEGADFAAADESTPATPRQIVSDRFSRDLAAMRSVSILLIFVTEFIFYEQVAANFDSDETIARFLGIFMAVATLAMVVCTAAVAGKFISRFGVGVGLASMPAGLATIAVITGLYGLLFGINFGFFALVVFGNLASLVLANAIETPVGAVMYQPMPVERRMPVRVAVDGWLGSVAVLAAGLLLLLFESLDFVSVLPFVWLLAAIGLVGVLLSRRLYDDYRHALADATTLAFSGAGSGGGSAGSAELLADLDEGRGQLQAGLFGDDPSAAFAVASLANDLHDDPLALVLPELADSDDPAVARLAVDALADSGNPAYAGRLGAIAGDQTRPAQVRAGALRGLSALDPGLAAEAAANIRRSEPRPADVSDTTGELAIVAMAVAVAASGSGPEAEEIIAAARSAEAEDRLFAAQVLNATRSSNELDPALNEAIVELVDDADSSVRAQALEAAQHRLTPELGDRLVAAGRRPEHRRRAVDALSTGGVEAVDMLDVVVDELPEAYVVDLVDHVYATNTRRPVVLHRFLEPTAPSPIRRAGFDAARRADVSLPASVNRLLRDDVEFARGLLAVWRDVVELGDGPPPPLIEVVLADEFDAARRAVWAGLQLAADSARIDEIAQLTSGADEDTRANAIEALDTLLPHTTRQLVVPVLEPKTIAEAAEIAQGLSPARDRRSALLELRDNPRTMQSTRQLIDHHLGHSAAADDDGDRNTETDDMSQTIERVIALKRVDIFSTLPYEVLAELAKVAVGREAAPGTEIIVEGAFGDELFALTRGEVRVDRSDGISTVLSAGTVFGELAVLDPGPRSATVVAQQHCELLAVARPMLIALTDRRPEVMAEIARVLSVRLRNNQV